MSNQATAVSSVATELQLSDGTIITPEALAELVNANVLNNLSSDCTRAVTEAVKDNSYSLARGLLTSDELRNAMEEKFQALFKSTWIDPLVSPDDCSSNSAPAVAARTLARAVLTAASGLDYGTLASAIAPLTDAFLKQLRASCSESDDSEESDDSDPSCDHPAIQALVRAMASKPMPGCASKTYLQQALYDALHEYDHAMLRRLAKSTAEILVNGDGGLSLDLQPFINTAIEGAVRRLSEAYKDHLSGVNASVVTSVRNAMTRVEAVAESMPSIRLDVNKLQSDTQRHEDRLRLLEAKLELLEAQLETLMAPTPADCASSSPNDSSTPDANS